MHLLSGSERHLLATHAGEPFSFQADHIDIEIGRMLVDRAVGREAQQGQAELA